MTRRLVRAWQLKVPSTYLPPGASKHEIRPEGTTGRSQDIGIHGPDRVAAMKRKDA